MQLLQLKPISFFSNHNTAFKEKVKKVNNPLSFKNHCKKNLMRPCINHGSALTQANLNFWHKGYCKVIQLYSKVLGRLALLTSPLLLSPMSPLQCCIKQNCLSVLLYVIFQHRKGGMLMGIFRRRKTILLNINRSWVNAGLILFSCKTLQLLLSMIVPEHTDILRGVITLLHKQLFAGKGVTTSL